MFLRKLFQVPDKVRWLSLELLVVFIGVYLAFVFQSMTEQADIVKEKEKVYVSLKKELDVLRMQLPRFADYQEGKGKEWDSLASIDKVAPFYTWRYIEPQYNFKVIEYAINLEGTDILDFELYEEILELYSNIKKLEHSERLMTEYGGRYKNIPSEINQKGEMALIMKAENKLNFYKFRIFADDRMRTLRETASASKKIVKMINMELGDEKTREIDMAFFRKSIENDFPIDFLEESFLEHFPQYPIEVLREEIAKFKSQ